MKAAFQQYKNLMNGSIVNGLNKHRDFLKNQMDSYAKQQQKYFKEYNDKVKEIRNSYNKGVIDNALNAKRYNLSLDILNSSAKSHNYFKDRYKKVDELANKYYWRQVGARVGTGAAIGAGLYGAKKLYDKHKEKTAFETVEESFDKIAKTILEG